MIQKAAWLIAGVALGWGAFLALEMRQATVVRVAGDTELESSLVVLADAIRDAGTFVETHHWYGSEQEQVEAFRHIVRVLIGSLEGEALADPDFPFFREVNTRTKAGMDNADQRYLIAHLNGDGVYRVWGDRGTSRRLDFTLYGEDDLSPSIDTLDTDALEVDADGRFELVIGGPMRPRNWLASKSGPVRLLIRQIHSDWENELPGDLHIDRIDRARPTYPTLTRSQLAGRITAASDRFARSVRRWPELGRTRLHLLMPANWLAPPRDTGNEGGLAGRLVVGGHFHLAEDEALIVTSWPTDAAYQGIQLGHHWWQSLDYANRQSSLTTDQARISADGAYHFVVSARDPGFHNWLDTEGFQRGIVMMRYDGLPTRELPPSKRPVARRVRFDEIAQHLPAGEPPIGPVGRRSIIAARRAHVQRRFGY